jgi:pimeloyl-ACP methyl ester carboxylesterase
MKFLQILTLLVAGMFAAPFSIAYAQPALPLKSKNVVLVHGAWADGSSWAEVIPLLQAAGQKVTAVRIR